MLGKRQLYGRPYPPRTPSRFKFPLKPNTLYQLVGLNPPFQCPAWEKKPAPAGL
ncbi:hypothetical protein NOC27_2796 [Nitrosococcus oceani AFC27]|nr:hypothetical protein NOC27_2796 [Nitrosococcus oceani AFC27]